MVEMAEVGMHNEDLSPYVDSLPPNKPFMDAEAMEERDTGTQKGVNGDGGVQLVKEEESLSSPPQSKEAEDGIQSEVAYVPPLDQASAILPPLHEHDESAPIEDESEEGVLVDNEVTADDGRVDFEPKVEHLDEMRQGETPVEVEQEPDGSAAAEIEQEPDVETPVDTGANASDPLETECIRQDLVVIQPDQHLLDDDFKTDEPAADELEPSRRRSDLHVGDADVGFLTITPKDGEFELGRVDSSVPEEGNTEEPQAQLVDDATELFCTAEEHQEHVNDTAGPFSITKEPQEQIVDAYVGGPAVDGKLSSEEAGDGANDLQEGALQLVDTDEGNPGVFEEPFQDDSAELPVSMELNEQVDHESPIDIVLDDPSAAPVSHEYALIKEPSLSTPDMEALTDVDNKEPLENCEMLENSVQCLDAEEAHEESAAGGDGQGAAEGTSTELEVEVDNNEQEKAENNAFDQDSPSADSACEVLLSSGQELTADTLPADEQDGKDKELGNDVFEQGLGTQQCPINEEPSIEPHAEQELDIEAPNSAEQEPLEKNLDSAPSVSELEMTAAAHKKGDEAVRVVEEEGDIDEQEFGLEASLIKQAGDVEGGVAAASALVEEGAITSNLDEMITENEPGGLALNSEQGLDNPDMKDASLLDTSASHDLCLNKQSDTEGLSSTQDNSVVQISDEADLALALEEEETGSSEDEVKIDAFNGQLDEHDPNKRLQDEQGSVTMTPCSNNATEANYINEICEQDEQDISSTLTPTQFEITANGNPNDVLESSVAPNNIRLSAHMLDNGSFPYTENGEKAEGSHVGLSTEPVVELGKVSDGMNKLEAPITVLENGMIYCGTVIEDGKYVPPEPLTYNLEKKDESNAVSEAGTQSVKAEDKDLNAGEEREIVWGSKGVTADLDATGTSNLVVLENCFLDGDLVKDSMGAEYMNGSASASIAARTKENAEAFHNERSREVSLSLVVPQQRDASENVRQMNEERTTESVTIARRTNWWGCCGMLDLLLRKD